MLLCWSGLNGVRYRRNKVVHPDVKASSAMSTSILRRDFGAPFAYLHADALRLANFLFEDEGGLDYGFSEGEGLLGGEGKGGLVDSEQWCTRLV